MKLYIVIPQYLINNELVELSKNAIDSFKNTSDCTLISVDDCGDRGVEMLKEKSDVYLKNEKNSGFAKTCNAGFRWILENEKEEAWVVCANNDIEVFEGWFEEFVKTMNEHNGDAIGGIGYRERIVEGKPLTEFKTNVGSLYNSSFISEGGRLGDWMFPGGFFMVKLSVLRELGLYDEGFLHGGYEDVDLFLRWKNAGKRLLMTPKVPYWHKEGATRFGEQEKGRQSDVEPLNRAYFEKKHGFDAHKEMNNFLQDNRINM